MQNGNSNVVKDIGYNTIIDTLRFLSYESVRQILAVIVCISSLGLFNQAFLHTGLQFIFLTILAYLAVEDIEERQCSVYLTTWLVLIVALIISLNYTVLIRANTFIPVSKLKLAIVSLIASLSIPFFLFILNLILIGRTGKNNLGFADVIILTPATAFSCLGYVVAEHTELNTLASIVIYLVMIVVINTLYLIGLKVYSLVNKNLLADLKASEQTPEVIDKIKKLTTAPFLVPIAISTFISCLTQLSV